MKKITLSLFLVIGLLTLTGVLTVNAQTENPKPKTDDKMKPPKEMKPDKSKKDFEGSYSNKPNLANGEAQVIFIFNADKTATMLVDAGEKGKTDTSGFWEIKENTVTLTIPSSEEGKEATTVEFQKADKTLTVSKVAETESVKVGDSFSKVEN